VARTLDFDESTTVGPRRAELRLAGPENVLRGPHKYQVLERRRRHAQIAARRVLDLIDVAERGGTGPAAAEKGK
jgi:hypothetical protein